MNPSNTRDRAASLRSLAAVSLLLIAGSSGCIETLTGRTQLYVSAENYSGKDLSVTLNLTSGERAADFDLGVVTNGSFSTTEQRLKSGSYHAVVNAGDLRVEREWIVEPGEEGLTLRIYNTTIDFLRLKID